MLTKPEAAIQLIKEALEAGILADYVLMDTLSDSEIVRIYGNRWSIECFF